MEEKIVSHVGPGGRQILIEFSVVSYTNCVLLSKCLHPPCAFVFLIHKVELVIAPIVWGYCEAERTYV